MTKREDKRFTTYPLYSHVKSTGTCFTVGQRFRICETKICANNFKLICIPFIKECDRNTHCSLVI